MRRACVLLTACALAWAPPARAADASPTPEQIEFAAHEHDLGYRAYVAKQFDDAATHFENAFFAAPNPAELRSAIRARRDAGELARAATLAALAQRKYPGEAALDKTAQETLSAARPHVYEVRISSSEECSVAVDERAALAEKAKEFRFFVDPGKHELLVGWSDDRTKRVPIDATAGGSQSIALQPPPRPPPPAAATRPAVSMRAAEAPPSHKPLGPAVFLVGAGLTAVGAGLTIWSGLDTESHPGTAAVRVDCVGQGASCPEYQQGLNAQLRTNVLLAATGGAALVTTVIGVFFTQWSHPQTTGASAPAASGGWATGVQPVVGLGGVGVGGRF